MSKVLAESDSVRPRGQAPGGSPRSGDEIDLLAYAESCWRYRYVLLAVALVVGAVTYAINRAIPPTYEVRFRLMASDPGVTEDATSRVSMTAFRELVESPTLVAGLLAEFGLDRPPLSLTPGRFLESHVTVDVIRDSTIIVVNVRLKDPAVLVKLATRYGEKVVDSAQRLNTEGIDYTAERIREQRDSTLKNLQAADARLREFQRTARLELLRDDVDTMLARRPEALDLLVQIQGERARLRQAEADLGKEERVRSVRSGVESVPQTRPEGAARPDDLKIRSELRDPYVNPVYEALSRDVTEARGRLAALEQRRSELVRSLGLGPGAADKINRLNEAEGRLEALTRDYEVARDAYVNAANKYEDARLQSTLRSPRLQILDAALPPDRPVAPRSARNTLTMMLLALTVAAVVVIARDPYRAR